MIALRARRQAYRIAADFLYEQPIDVDTFACRSCGHLIRPEVFDDAGRLHCGVCGVRNQVPNHLRSRTTAPVVAESGKLDYWPSDAHEERRRRVLWVVLIVVYTAMVMAWLIAFAGLR
jgi:hypothetical protein